jgi:hypothetical protein
MSHYEWTRPHPLTVAEINERLSFGIEKLQHLEQLQKIVERPMHYFYPLEREKEVSDKYIKNKNSDFLSVPVGIEQGMSANLVLANILRHKSFDISWRDREFSSFSKDIVSIGKEKNRDIRVILWDIHFLSGDQQAFLLDKIQSADMKSFGGVREIPGARKIQFIANGDTEHLHNPFAWQQFFNNPGESHAPFNKAVAVQTYKELKEAFQELEVRDESWVRSPRKTGKSAAAAVFRRQFPEKVFILKLDKLIKSPQEIIKAPLPESRAGQITIVDRAEVLQGSSEAIQFLTDRFGKVIYLESTEEKR